MTECQKSLNNRIMNIQFQNEERKAAWSNGAVERARASGDGVFSRGWGGCGSPPFLGRLELGLKQASDLKLRSLLTWRQWKDAERGNFGARYSDTKKTLSGVLLKVGQEGQRGNNTR